ncbi:MAG TPA: hypothetical protein DCS93_04700 [Microscillaceae bacterium]|nr:hypothetical protein [Microscillaceae bacterium]
MAEDFTGRRGCSGLLNLGLSVVVLLGIVWMVTQKDFSFSDFTKRFGKISSTSSEEVLLTVPLVSDQKIPQTDLVVVKVKKDESDRKNAENQYEIQFDYKSAANKTTAWEQVLASKYKDGHQYVKCLYDQENIYVIIKDFIYALARKSGDKIWTLRLRDQVSPECTNCISIVQRKLMVLTTDRILHSINTLNGNILKKNRLETPKAQGIGFYAIKNKIVLTDQLEDKPSVSASVIVINPITLMPLRFFTPTAHRKLDSGKVYRVDMPLAFDKIGSHVYMMPEGTHVQCWDIDNGKKNWDKQLPSRVLLPDKMKDLQFVEHQTSMYLQGTSGNSNIILKLDLLDGAMKSLVSEVDYSLSPLIGYRNQLFVLSQKTRGNQRSDIWALNNKNGFISWRYNLRNHALYNPSTQQGNLYYAFYKGNLLVIQYLAEDKQILVEKLNPMNGRLIKKSIKDVEGSKWNQIVATDHQVYFSMDEVYRLDLKTGEIETVDY